MRPVHCGRIWEIPLVRGSELVVRDRRLYAQQRSTAMARLTKVATGGAPKRALPHGAGGGSRRVRSVGGAAGGGNASAASAAAASTGTASEVAVRPAGGGGEVDAVAAVPPFIA